MSSSPTQPIRGSYFFPVDGEGVLLPTSEFAQAETRQYIHIEVPDAYSTNAIGTPLWRSSGRGSGPVGRILAPYREQAQIRSIGVHGDPRQTEIPQLELTRHDGGKWYWGSPPGAELPGEHTVQMKLRRMLSTEPSQNADLRMASPPGRELR